MALKELNPCRPGIWIVAKLCFFLFAFFLNGCSGLGPSTLKGNRYNYNTTIQRSNDQQLLLNLVRLKYRDTPYFLEVNSVAAQFKFRANADADATLQDGVKGLFGFGVGASVEENPTISYAPLQGEQFIQRFLSHIPLQNIFLLTRSGWSFERIFRVCLERVGGLKNAPTASGPTPVIAPVYRDFAEAALLIRKSRSAGHPRMEGGSRAATRCARAGAGAPTGSGER